MIFDELPLYGFEVSYLSMDGNDNDAQRILSSVHDMINATQFSFHVACFCFK